MTTIAEFSLPCADCGRETALSQGAKSGALIYCVDCAAAYVPSRDARPRYAGPWKIDPISGQAVAPERKDVALTPTELKVLLALDASPGIVAQATIAWRLWGGVNSNLVRKYVQRLRETLGTDSIVTAPRFGYRLIRPATPKE